jgi:hypothetical protein
MIAKYLSAIYEDGGRELPRLDCWGMTILARSELYGLPMLSSFGAVHRQNALGFQRAYRAEVERALEECQPFPGAIAAALGGDVCTHVGLVIMRDGKLQVLETNPASGARVVRLQEFKDSYMKVVFYRDRDPDQQA